MNQAQEVRREQGVLFAGREFTREAYISSEDVRRFAELTGDWNPLHLDDEEAKARGFPSAVAPGFLVIALASPLITAEMDGVVVRKLKDVSFNRPIPVEKALTIVVTVDEVLERSRWTEISLRMEFRCSGYVCFEASVTAYRMNPKRNKNG